MHAFSPKLQREIGQALNESVAAAAPRFLGASLAASELASLQWVLIKPAQSALHCMALLQQRDGDTGRRVRTVYALMTMPSGKIIVQFSEAVQQAHTHPCACFIVPSASASALAYVEVHVRRCADESSPSGIEVTLVRGTLFAGTAPDDEDVCASRAVFPGAYELASIRISDKHDDSFLISDAGHAPCTVSFDSLERIEAAACALDDIVKAATLRIATLSKAQRLGFWLREMPLCK